MEKLLEELISRLENAWEGIKELQRLINYYKESILKS